MWATTLLSVLLLTPPGGNKEPVLVGPLNGRAEHFLVPLSAFRSGDSLAATSAFGQAVEAFKRKDYRRTLAILDGPLKNFQDPEVLNLYGAVLTEMDRTEEAIVYFQRALALRPSHFWARYNLAEVDLLAGRPAAARAGFQALKPRDKNTDELLDLKMVLTYLVEKKSDEATKLVTAMPDPPVSASGFAARAAMAFYARDLIRARQFLAEAETLFPGQMEGFLRSTLEEFGMTEEALKKE